MSAPRLRTALNETAAAHFPWLNSLPRSAKPNDSRSPRGDRSVRGAGVRSCPSRSRFSFFDASRWRIVLGIVGWVLGLSFVMILMRMAGGEDRAARHEENRLDPFSDVSITQTGVG